MFSKLTRTESGTKHERGEKFTSEEQTSAADALPKNQERMGIMLNAFSKQ